MRLLLEEKREKKEYADIITTDYLIDEIVTFVLAGIDSSSTFLASMMLYVFEKPAVANKLREEINSVVKSDADITL